MEQSECDQINLSGFLKGSSRKRARTTFCGLLFDLHLTFPTDPNRVAKQSFNKSDKDTKSPKQMHRPFF